MEDTATLSLHTYICSPSYTCRPTFPGDEVSDVYRETSPPRADPEAGHAVFLKQEPCPLDQFNEELSSHSADSTPSLQGHEDGLCLPGNSCSQGQIQTNFPIALISQIKEEVNDEDNLFNLSNSSDRIGNESVEAERICQEAILPEGTVLNSDGFYRVSKEEVPDEVEELGHTVSKSCVVVLCKLPSGVKRNSFVVESEYGVWDFVDRVGNRIHRFDSFSPESRRAIHGRVRNQFGNVETFSINIWDPALRKYNTLFDKRRTLPPSRNLEHNTGKYCPSSAFNCNLCEATFGSGVHLKVHMRRRHTGKRSFTCSYCPASFSVKVNWQYHERTHRENRRIFVCKRCKVSYCQASHLMKHMFTHHGEKPFKCGRCSATFADNDHLLGHIRTTHTEESQVCGKESQVSISAEVDLTNPMRTLISDELFNCNFCAATFENEPNLRSHMLSKHIGKKPQNRRTFVCTRCNMTFCNYDGYKPFTCSYCPASFFEKITREHHERTHRENKRIFVCKRCKMTFCLSAQLIKHTVTHHSEQKFKCSYCSASFEHSGHLERHMTTHTGERQVCGRESQKSISAANLANPMRTLNSYKPLNCNLCAAAFENEANLRSHMCERHPGKQLFTCRYCPASFNLKHCWKKHLRTHREKKRIFICKECKMSFCRPAHLKKHMLTHCGGKPFKCNHCGAAFGDNGLLGRHMMTHTGEKQDFGSDSQNSVSTAVNSVDRLSAPKSDKPFKCNVCKANFASKFNLERHMVVHTNEISFTCNLCGDVFGSERYLNAHMSRWHTGFKPHTEEEQASGSESENSVSTEVSSVNPVRTLNNDQCLSCKFCGADFKRRCDFDTHIHKHTREKSFACSYCPASFFNNARFISHERSHRENRQSFICKWCKMSFHYSARLVKHTLAHHSEQKFKCSYCSASFAYNGHLERHIMTTHTEKKLRRGSETQKSLREEEQSMSHTRSHDEKYFNSSDCRNSSSRKSGLEAPLQTQWQTANETKFEKRGVYACDLCPMTYCYPSYLVNHLRTHLGERSHKCSHCPAAFASSSDLERHVMTHQKEERVACSKTRESSSEVAQSASHSEMQESSFEGAQSTSHSEIRQSASHSEIRQSASHHEIRQSASHSEIRQSASHSKIRQSGGQNEIRESSFEGAQSAGLSEIRQSASQSEIQESSFEGAQSTSHSEIRESSFEGTQSASHMRTQKDGNLLKCWYCPATFSRPKFRSRHIASHNFGKKHFPSGCSSPSSARTKQLSTHPSPREERFSCEGTPVKPL